MAEINDFIDPKAEAQVRTYINSLGEIVTKYNAIFDASVKVNEQTGNALKSQKSITDVQKQSNEVAKQAEAIARSQAAAAAALDKQRQAALANLAKQEAKERELQAAINMEVKSLQDAQTQTSALNKVKKSFDLTTESGRAALEKYNIAVAKNTEFIRANQDPATKQMMNIGNYPKTFDLASMSVGELRKMLIELRNTSFAGKTQEEIAALNQKIGDVIDQLGDLKSMQKAMGTELGSQIAGSLKMISAGVEGVAASLTLFGVGEENIAKVQKNLVALIAVTQALGAIEDGLQTRVLQNTAIRIKNSAVEAYNTVIKWSNATATTASAAAEEARGVIMGRASVTTKAAAAVQWLWNAALAANPIGLVIVGVAALAAGIAALVIWQKKSSNEEAIMAEKRRVNLEQLNVMKATMSEVSLSAQKGYVDEKIKLDQLRRTISDTNIGTQERKEALESLIDLDPKHLKGLTLEEAQYGKMSTKIDSYIAALKATALAKAIESKLSEQYVKQFENEQKIKEKAYEVEFNSIGLVMAQKKLSSIDALTESNAYALQVSLVDNYRKKLDAAKVSITGLTGEQKGLAMTTEQLEKSFNKIKPSDLVSPQGKESGPKNKGQDKRIDAEAEYQEAVRQSLEKGTEFTNEEYAKRNDAFQKSMDADLESASQAAAEEAKVFEAYMQATYAEQISSAQRIADAKVNILKKQLATGEITEEEYAVKTFELQKSGLQSVIDSLSTQLSYAEEGTARKIELSTQLAEAQQELDNITTDNFVANEEKKREALATTAQKIGEIAQGVFDFGASLNDRKLSKLEADKARELNVEGLSAEKKQAIEEKYAKKVGDIKRKQAIADKAAALFSIALNTAIAAMKVTGQTGIGASLAVPLVIAMGALQSAAVLAKPIPAYKEGIRNAPRGLALVGEAGAELVEKGSSMQLINKPTILNLSGGETIYKNADTKRILSAAKLSSTSDSNRVLVQTIVESNDRVVRTIKNKSEWHIEADGSVIEDRGGHHTNYFNKKVKWLQKQN